jgi:ATP-dependent DNA helicase RecQ
MTKELSKTKLILNQSVFIDLEIHSKTQQLLKIGAWHPLKNKSLYYAGRFNRNDALQALFKFISSCDFIVGHNIHEHDWPYLIEKDVTFKSLSNKLIDTLTLNPLAFPENPYHSLVKDYKMQRESINDPVEDCKQTEKLFKDQCHNFIKEKDLGGIYGRYLTLTSPAYTQLFKKLLGKLPDKNKIHTYLLGHSFSQNKVCRTSLKQLLPTLVGKNAEQHRSFAYALAWLSIAGGSSVLPAWVRHQHETLVKTLNQLRNQPCEYANCHYCKKHHHLETNLEEFFNYPKFRHFGKGDNPKNPLQRQIVTSVCKAQPTLAILPTGGGKSLCYQLPAMMLARNRGLLTLIISPLQSLMRDQVQQLNDRGYLFAASLNSSLSMPERHKVLESIRMGDIHLLYIAPEQLRNNSFIDSIKSREIGQWIIDEAHCLSKWGHDFRPDYLYIGKFIKGFSKKHKQPLPPIHAFTATARLDVIDEIKDHFKKTLGMEVQLLSGGHTRNNLNYRVLPCAMFEKREKVLELLHDYKEDIGDGAVVVFCNRRKVTEEMSRFLSDNGWPADYFHAGRNPKEKQQIQQSFMDGGIHIMAATNAFGMGVDKSNIRLVIHAQMPDSIENYLQEAGRAGRDGKPAHCILLFNDDDADKQFEMRRNQQIDFRDFVSLFEAIRRKAKASKDSSENSHTIQVSSGEIVRQAESEDDLELGFDGRDYQSDTKVRTAIAWLEEEGFLERTENKTGVIEGSFLINTKEKIEQCLKQQNLSTANIKACLKVALAVMQYNNNESINADKIAEQTGMEAKDVFRKIRCLQAAKIMDHDMSLIAWLTAGVRGDSKKILSRFTHLEKQLLALIQEESQGDIEQDFHLNIHAVCHKLHEQFEERVLPNDILLLLALWGQLDGVVKVMQRGKDCFLLKWRKEFPVAEEDIRQRHLFSDVSLSWLYDQVANNEKGKDLRIPFKLGQLEEELGRNMLTCSFKKAEERSEKTLLALEKSHALGLDSGSAIFHPAMTLHIPKNKRKPGKNSYAPLAEHYQAQIRQVHLMREWAIRMAVNNETSAAELLNDYFQLSEKELLKQYFPNTFSDLETSATPERVETIIGESALSNVQRDIVEQAIEQNMLVLAGPGSGKTRLLVHRVAWLVCVQRVKPESILILAFNRSTVTELRRRLGEDDMLGTQAYALEIHTYHSLAMQLLGEFPPEDSDAFKSWSEQLIPKAVNLLSNHDEEASDLRRKLMTAFQHILVDEYQDVNQTQYELLSAMAGRALQAEEERLTMFAVGDDDQNIYEWNGTSNNYIQQFQDDYQASIQYMTVNYRSAPNIIEVCNGFIAQHPNRLKEDHPITAYKKNSDGKVRLFTGLKSALHTRTVEICKHLIEKEQLKADRIAILCRDHNEYQCLASALRYEKLPICIIRDGNDKSILPWYKLREVHAMLEIFDGNTLLSAIEIRRAWKQLPVQVQNHQSTQVLWQWLSSYHDRKAIIRSRYEWRSEIRELSYDVRKKMGHGIHLGTMHSAKGLEFDSVIVFAGHKAHKELEERRLRYVAMTRAERNLILMRENIDWFGALNLEEEKLPLEARESPEGHDIYHCKMKDVDLDFVGRMQNTLYTADIDVGSVLTLHSNEMIFSSHDKAVGKFSKEMTSTLKNKQQQGWQILSVKVHAIIRRSTIDSKEGRYRDLCKQDAWDLIIPEISFQKNGYA